MRINQILSVLKQTPYFTKQNLGLALGKDGDDLNYWVKKLIKEKLLVSLKKGFYVSSYYKDMILKDPQASELYWVYLANVLRPPSYVSLEYVLSKASLIPEAVFGLTSVTLKSPRKYQTKWWSFIYRNIKKELYCGYQLKVLGNTGLTARIAYPGKALFDFLYLRKSGSVRSMKQYLLADGRINWSALSSKERQKFKQFMAKSGSKKMQMMGKILTKEKIL